MTEQPMGIMDDDGVVADPAPAEDAGPAASGAMLVPLDDIQLSPTAAQAHRRGIRDEEALRGLAASIEAEGLLSPVLVRRAANGGSLELVAGERRYEAHRLLGRTEIAALEVDRDAADVAQIVENLQREDLDPMTESIACRDLAAAGLSTDEIARRIGRGESTVRSRISLTRLPDEARDALAAGTIVLATAELIARFPAEARPAVLATSLPEEWQRDAGAVPYRQVEMRVVRRHSAAVRRGGFDPRDDTLGGRGACHGCAYHSTGGGVFDGHCLDTACWADKSDKAADRSLAYGADHPVEQYSRQRHYLPEDRMPGPDGMWQPVRDIVAALGAEPQTYQAVVRADPALSQPARHVVFWRRKDVRALLPAAETTPSRGSDGWGWEEQQELVRRLWKLLGELPAPPPWTAAVVLRWMLERLDDTEAELALEEWPDPAALAPREAQRAVARLLDLDAAYCPPEAAAAERGIDVEAVKAAIVRERKA